MDKPGPGRPRLDIDDEQVRQLALIQCTYEEMAAVLKCSTDTLSRNYAGIIKECRDFGKISLRRAQYNSAMQGNIGMLVWLGKQWLGQADSRVLELNVGKQREALAQKSDAEIAQLAKEALERMKIANPETTEEKSE